METLIRSKIIFVVDVVRLPLIIIVVVVIVVCRRYLSTATLLAVSDREAIGCRHSCRLIDYPQVESHRSFHPVSPGRREWNGFDGSAIRDNRARSAIRFVRTRESHVLNRRAIPIAYLSMNKIPGDGVLNRERHAPSFSYI